MLVVTWSGSLLPWEQELTTFKSQLNSDTGAPCAFVLADALYGPHSRIRRMLEARQQPPYGLATQWLRWPHWCSGRYSECGEDHGLHQDATAFVGRYVRLR